MGCGPGLYAEGLAQEGFQVTGVDFSKRSIDYGKRSAGEKGLDIAYVHQNYLELHVEGKFDCAIMIYCDYGVLSPDKRNESASPTIAVLLEKQS